MSDIKTMTYLDVLADQIRTIDTTDLSDVSEEVVSRVTEEQRVYFWIRLYLKEDNINAQIGDDISINWKLSGEKLVTKFICYGKTGLNKDYQDEMTKSTLDSIYAMKSIQEKNGEFGSNRYIISNCESAIQVMETFALFRLCDWENPTVDIIPLFEVIDDLQNAHLVMEQLYTNETYLNHIKNRGNKQTVMLGFSDGTKDGGYLMANWSIYKAKENITTVSRKYGIKVVFFDGRGGPPARGGGKTHKFYASLGTTIENKENFLLFIAQTELDCLERYISILKPSN